MATANAIDQLPPELLRKGRFDEIFVLDLPDGSERREILELHLRKRRPQHQLPLETLVDRTSGFSGAELEQVVLEGMLNAFSESREFGEADLISAAADLVPLSRTAREQLEVLQQWASEGRARPAR
jgi:SpoVK/Ycf46/Vps4 family AAA+-type ATPase